MTPWIKVSKVTNAGIGYNLKGFKGNLKRESNLIFFFTALLEQNHKIKDWRIDIKKAVSKDSSSGNQSFNDNRNDGRAFSGGFGNFGRGYNDRGRGGGPAPRNSGAMGNAFGNDDFGGGWGGGMRGNMGCDMGGSSGEGMMGGMGSGMDGPMGGMGGMGNQMGGPMSGAMGGGISNRIGGNMGNENRNNPWSMPSSSMGIGGNMGGMNSSWENQGNRGGGNNFSNEDAVWGNGNNIDNDHMGSMMGTGFSTGMGGGAMQNRSMPFNGGMGGPGPMRNHMGSGNVLQPVESSKDFDIVLLNSLPEARSVIRTSTGSFE